MFRKGLFCALVCMGLMLSLSGPAFAVGDGLTVTSPSHGNIWHSGKTHTIAWTIGSAEGFGITLMDSTGKKNVHHIASVGSKIREYKWTVPASIPPGKYRVQVTSVAVFEWQTPIVSQSPVFEIRNGLIVTSPSQGAIWCLEKPYTIAWTVGFGEGFGITLMDSAGTKSAHHITSVGSKIREYKWMIPASIPPGKYRVQVTSVAVFEWQTPIVSQSPVFEIRKCDGPDPFKGLIDHLRPLQFIEWWRIDNPRPFPNPCLSCPPEFNLEKIREIFVKADLKEQVHVDLFSGRARIARLGTFGRGSVPQRTLKLQRIGMTESRALQGGRGFQLVIRNMQGQMIHTQNIGMKEVAPPAAGRR